MESVWKIEKVEVDIGGTNNNDTYRVEQNYAMNSWYCLRGENYFFS